MSPREETTYKNNHQGECRFFQFHHVKNLRIVYEGKKSSSIRFIHMHLQGHITSHAFDLDAMLYSGSTLASWSYDLDVEQKAVKLFS